MFDMIVAKIYMLLGILFSLLLGVFLYGTAWVVTVVAAALPGVLVAYLVYVLFYKQRKKRRK